MEEAMLAVLFRKKTADLSGGYYSRGDVVSVENRSQYNDLAAREPASLGMGIVQAVLAVLSQHVASFSWGDQGRIGLATLYSTSKRPKTLYPYQFSWDERVSERPSYGGFANGLTYQLVMLHLITSYLDAIYRASEARMEVVRRWIDLVRAMEASYGRDSEGGWSDDQISRACRNRDIQPHVERVSDALWFSMRYQLPDKGLDRSVRLWESSVLSQADISQITMKLAGQGLLRPPEQGYQLQKEIPPTRGSRQNRLKGVLLLDEQSLSRFLGERGKRIEEIPDRWDIPGEEEFF